MTGLRSADTDYLTNKELHGNKGQAMRTDSSPPTAAPLTLAVTVILTWAWCQHFILESYLHQPCLSASQAARQDKLQEFEKGGWFGKAASSRLAARQAASSRLAVA